VFVVVLVVAAAGVAVAANRIGNDQANTLDGTDNADAVYGLGANDTLNGLGGKDEVSGNAGADRMNGGNGDDVMVGGPGKDNIKTGNSANTTTLVSLLTTSSFLGRTLSVPPKSANATIRETSCLSLAVAGCTTGSLRPIGAHACCGTKFSASTT
jgi:Ca2+-binding RTX toxin-like protein